MKLVKVRTLASGWVDKDHILLHAAFQLLKDFMEEERPDRRIDWSADRRSARAWREIKALYRWWTKVRPARREPLDRKGLKLPPWKFEPVPGQPSLMRRVEHDRKKYRGYERALRKQAVLEKRWLQEDQRNLHRLIEIRLFLWT